MLKQHVFNLLIAVALVIVITFTVREAVATTAMRSQAGAVMKCASLPSRYSIHTVFVEERGRSLTYTEDGPTGVDGGLIYLLSRDRTCS
jgi:hypothetical protein